MIIVKTSGKDVFTSASPPFRIRPHCERNMVNKMTENKILNEKEFEEVLTTEGLEKAYDVLFNGISYTIEQLEGSIRQLKMFQQIAENNIIAEGKDELISFDEI